MRRAHQQSAGIRDCRTTGFRHQRHIHAGLQRGQQRRDGRSRRVLVELADGCSVDRARVFNQFEKGARGFRIFRDEMGEPVRDLAGATGQYAVERAIAQAGRQQVKNAAGGVCSHGIGMPSFCSMVTRVISGRPISAVGSSLSTCSTSVMPNASILALPAQS